MLVGLSRARGLTKLVASSLHLPPVSMPRTTRRHRRLRMSSGYVRSFLRRASSCILPGLRRGWPSRVRGETMVVSTASWAPPKWEGRLRSLQCGDRLVCGCGQGFKSVSKVLVVTRAPSLPTHAGGCPFQRCTAVSEDP